MKYIVSYEMAKKEINRYREMKMKYEVTDEILEIAYDAYCANSFIKNGRNAMKVALEAVFDHISKEGKKVKENAQGGDGWIKHLGCGKPDNIKDETILQIKTIFSDDEPTIKKIKGENIYWAWWDWQQWHSRIVAYRIVQEPKEEINYEVEKYKKQTQDAWDKNKSSKYDIKPPKEEKKELDKQTLKEFYIERNELSTPDIIHIIEEISDYLEEKWPTIK